MQTAFKLALRFLPHQVHNRSSIRHTMSSSVLRPPNRQTLSDNVIGSVVQRFIPSHSVFIDSTRQEPNETSSSNALRDPLSKIPRPYRRRTLGIKIRSCVGASSDRNALAVEKINRRRERCRKSQAVYRMKQQKLLEDLEQATTKLRDEIHELERKRVCLFLTVQREHDVWTAATEYLRRYRHGVHCHSNAQHADTADFLRSTMSQDVRCGDGCGVDAMMKSWERFSACFDNIDIKIESLKKQNASGLVAATTARVTVSETTLRVLFPHLNSDGKGVVDGGKWSVLATTLLGRPLVTQGSVLFRWDPATSRMVSVQSQLDLLTPTLRLLGNLENVSRVFGNALITLDGRVKDKEKLKGTR